MKSIRGFSRVSTIVAIVVVLAIAIGAYEIGQHHTNSTSSSTNSSQVKVAVQPSGLKYPSPWQELPQIPQSDKDVGVVSEAQRTNPSANTIVRIVNGSLDKNFDIQQLPSQTVTSLQKGLDKFVALNQKVAKLGKRQVVEVTYKNDVGGTTYQNTILIVPTKNKVFYVTFSAKANDFAKISGDINSIRTRAAAYVDSHLN